MTALFAAWLLLSACASESIASAQLSAESVDSTAPSNPQQHHAWLVDGGYKPWISWGNIRESTIADGGVRVYWNPALHRSLRARAERHPVGSAAVRELFEDDLKTLRGWSTMVKVDDQGTADDWLFFEVFSPLPAARPAIAKRGAPGCLGCHESAPDFVQSEVAVD